MPLAKPVACLVLPMRAVTLSSCLPAGSAGLGESATEGHGTDLGDFNRFRAHRRARNSVNGSAWMSADAGCLCYPDIHANKVRRVTDLERYAVTTVTAALCAN